MAIGSAGDAVFVPIIPSFDKFFAETQKASAQAGKSAGEKFAQEMERSTAKAQKAVDSAAKAQERAHNRAADAADKTRIAQLKLNETLEKGTATQSQIASATAAYEKAQRDEAAAVKASEQATRNYEQAQDNLAKITREAQNATEAGADAVRDFGDAAEGADGKSRGLELSMTQVAAAAAAGAAAVGAAGKALYDIGAEFDDAYDTIRIGTGASGEAFAELQESMRNVARDSIGVGSDLGEIGTTLADLNTRLGVTGEPLEKLTTQFQQLKGMGMETDINAVTGAFTQFGVEADAMPDMMDTLFQISQATGRGMDDLVNNLSKSGPALQQFGFGLTESAGLLGALDKAGLDSEKTLGSMTKALGEFAKNGEDPQQALWGTIQQIEELQRAGKNMEAVDLANSIFGAKGGAGFVAAVESGQFAYDDFMDSIGASADTINGLADETADFAERWDQLKLQAKLAIEPIATAVFDAMVPALETAWDTGGKLVDRFKELGGWVQNNATWLGPLVAAIGSAAAAVAVWQGAIMGWKKAVDLAKAAQVAFTAVMNANPIMLMVTAIAALVGGLTFFFTQTEKGRELWEKFTDALKSGWDGAQQALTAGFELVKSGFSALGDLVQSVWTKVIKPTFDAFAAAADWLWRNALVPAFDGIKAAFQAVGDAMRAVYDTVIKPVFDMVVQVAQLAWDGLMVVFDGIRLAWQAVGDGMNWVNQNIIQPMLQALGAGFTWLHDTVVAPVTSWIGEKWAQLGDGMNAVKGFIVDTVFGGLKAGLDAVQGWFESIVNGIRATWDKLRGYLASPINFMINTVYNDGILRAWNVIAGILPGLNKGDRLAGIPGYATGGRIKGPGTGTSDDILAWLSNGEHVLTAKEVQMLGGHGAVEALRKAVKSGRGFTFDGKNTLVLPARTDNRVGDLAGAAPGLLPRFATGGRVDDSRTKKLWEIQLERAHQFAKSQSGKPYQWAGPNGPGSSFDCSGFMGAIAATIQGTSPWQRYWATMSFPSPGAQGFAPGLGPGFSVGIFNGGPYGGHTAGTLSAVGPYSTVNVESGGSPSRVKYGLGAVGADHSQFTMHYHLPIGADGAFVSGGAGGVSPEEMRTGIGRALNGMIDKVMNPIVGLLPSPPPMWQGIPRGVYESGKTGLVKFVDNGVAALSDGLGTVFTAISGGIDRLINGDSVEFAAARQVGVFDRGGLAYGKGYLRKDIIEPERVLSPAQTRGYDHAVAVLPRAALDLRIAAEEISEAFRGGDFGYGALAQVLRNEDWAKAIVSGAASLGKMADPTSLEGIAGRSFASELADIVGSLGMTNTAQITGTLMAAEKNLIDARAGHAERLAKIAANEKALDEARAALAKVQSEKNDDPKAQADAVAKATEDVNKAEGELLDARRKSAAALDMTVHSVFPQLSGMAENAAAATSAFPPLSGALSAVAAATGPAGMSLGVVVTGVKSIIEIGKTLHDIVQRIVSGVKQAKVEVYQGLSQAMGSVKELNAMYAKQREQVAGLVVAWQKAMLDMQAAARGLRIMQMDGIISQLKGAKDVAVAQANLNKHMKAGRKTMDENRSAWRGFYTDLQYGTKEAGKEVVDTWVEAGAYVGMTQEQIADSIAQSQEEYLAWMREREALEIEIEGARAQQRVLELQAQQANLEAAYKYASAVMSMESVTRQLESAAKNLAIMSGKAFGFDQAGAMVGQRVADLLTEKAQIEAEQSANRLKLFSWHASGANRAANTRKAQIDSELQRLYAMPEWEGWSPEQQASINAVMSQARRLGALGGSASIDRLIKTSAIGDPGRAMADIQLRTELQGLKDQQAAMNEQMRKAALDAAYQIQSEPLAIKIKAAEMDKAVFDARAEAARSDSEVVRAALGDLAKAYEKSAVEMRGIAEANPRVISLNVPSGKTAFTTAEMRELTDEFNRQVSGLEIRLEGVERRGNARAADVAMSRR